MTSQWTSQWSLSHNGDSLRCVNMSITSRQSTAAKLNQVQFSGILTDRGLVKNAIQAAQLLR